MQSQYRPRQSQYRPNGIQISFGEESFSGSSQQFKIWLVFRYDPTACRARRHLRQLFPVHSSQFFFLFFKSMNWFKLLIIIWMETNVMVVSMLTFQYMTASAHLWGLVACRNRGGTIETERSTTSGLVPTQTTTNTYTCQCGIERNCVDPNVKCNCD